MSFLIAGLRKQWPLDQIWSPVFIFIFWLFRPSPTAYGGSHARGGIRAVATSLCHRHSNAKSEPRLCPTPQFTTTPDPQSTEQGQGST